MPNGLSTPTAALSAAVAAPAVPSKEIRTVRRSGGMSGLTVDDPAASGLLAPVCGSGDESHLGEPGQRLLLPGVPHRPLVAVEAVAAGGQLQVLRLHLVRQQGLVERLAVVGHDDAVVQG